MRTCSLQSGSNGNAIYVEADGVKLLFDAGITGRQAKLRLAEHGRDLHEVQAVILSHGHSDHCGCAAVFARRYRLPIYATPATHRCTRGPDGRPLDGVRHFQPGDTLRFGAVAVHTLPTPHDAPESVAFIVEGAGSGDQGIKGSRERGINGPPPDTGGSRDSGRRRLGIFTDLGHPFAALAGALLGLDAAYLESNYDPVMLEEGTYPPELKARIRGDGGHLSNEEAAGLLRDCGLLRPKWVALAHLSEHNNTPELALRAHRAQLGPDYPLFIASRYGVSGLLEV